MFRYTYEDHLKNVHEIAKELGIPTTSDSDSLADITRAMLDEVNTPLEPIASISDDDTEWNKRQQSIEQGFQEIDDLLADLAL